jgi:hypothetical protein
MLLGRESTQSNIGDGYMSKSEINEATLEATVHALFVKLFPKLNPVRMTHQKTFKLIIGHHNITINTKEQYKKGGRLDILICYDGKPLVVIELKKPGETITFRDAEQGISYARLLDEMPPIVIVTNGKDTEFYTTYDKQKWQPETIDEETVSSVFNQVFEMATTDKDDAVRLLLSTNGEVWEEVISQLNERNLNYKIGEVQNFSKPIVKKLQIPRKVTKEIKGLLDSHFSLITLVGTPLSGKTNVLYELCFSEDSDYIP